MINIKSVFIALLYFTLVFFIECDKNHSNPSGPDIGENHQDTSIFIGTWVSIFDTTDDKYGSKRDKKMIWCLGMECNSPDTFVYVNDTLYISIDGFEFYYTYDKDTIRYYSHLAGTNQLIFESASPYHLSNDTLILSPDTIRIDPDIYTCTIVNKRISLAPKFTAAKK